MKLTGAADSRMVVGEEKSESMEGKPDR
jgi:hypothetical protein